jgi:hypothetical protein
MNWPIVADFKMKEKSQEPKMQQSLEAENSSHAKDNSGFHYMAKFSE